MLILKIYYFKIFLIKKYFKKQPLPHFQIFSWQERMIRSLKNKCKNISEGLIWIFVMNLFMLNITVSDKVILRRLKLSYIEYYFCEDYAPYPSSLGNSVWQVGWGHEVGKLAAMMRRIMFVGVKWSFLWKNEPNCLASPLLSFICLV
jgi:hypothetical protein